MADTEDQALIKRVQALKDLTAQVTAHYMPSVLLSSADDHRVDKLVNSQTEAFIIRSEGSASFLAIVNPKKMQGILWWKRATRLVFFGDRWSKLQNGTESLNPDEKRFIQGL